jgi:hypothetical protein
MARHGSATARAQIKIALHPFDTPHPLIEPSLMPL